MRTESVLCAPSWRMHTIHIGTFKRRSWNIVQRRVRTRGKKGTLTTISNRFPSATQAHGNSSTTPLFLPNDITLLYSHPLDRFAGGEATTWCRESIRPPSGRNSVSEPGRRGLGSMSWERRCRSRPVKWDGEIKSGIVAFIQQNKDTIQIYREAQKRSEKSTTTENKGLAWDQIYQMSQTSS